MRWLLQARQDLDDADYNLKGKRYHLVCFLSQQAGEKALKALLYAKGEEIVLGHSVAKLLKSAIRYDTGLAAIKDTAGLDKYYIPTRYPNGLPGGVPYEACQLPLP
jgi:HEPN domain-containing protein